MAAPSLTARAAHTSGARFIREGYRTQVAFASKPGLDIWEQTNKPPGFTAGDMIDITVQANNRYRTKSVSHLIDMTDGTTTCAYDPSYLSDVIALIGVPTSVTWYYPDGTTVVAYAVLQRFEPNELRIREFPTAQMTIVVTNWDPVNAIDEPPVITGASGTA